jgi:hypothetical protein
MTDEDGQKGKKGYKKERMCLNCLTVPWRSTIGNPLTVRHRRVS